MNWSHVEKCSKLLYNSKLWLLKLRRLRTAFFSILGCLLMLFDCNHSSERWPLALSFVGPVRPSTPAVMFSECAPIYTTSTRSAQPQWGSSRRTFRARDHRCGGALASGRYQRGPEALKNKGSKRVFWQRCLSAVAFVGPISCRV